MSGSEFRLSVTDLAFVGEALDRPECVLATGRGDLYTSDRSGGVRHVDRHGRQRLIGGRAGITSNGIALLPDRSFLIANLEGQGGVWRLDPATGYAPYVMSVDGVDLVAVNFVRLDAMGRVWICANAPVDADGRYPTERREGFIAVVDDAGARIVANSIGWANECVLPISADRLFVNETFARCVSVFDVAADGGLSNRRVVTEFGHGTYPDGLALDEDGALWVISVASNRVIRVMPDGDQHLVLDDSVARHMDALEDALARNQLTRSLLTLPQDTVLKSISSIAFGGRDRRTAYLGCLFGDRLATFRAPVAGVRPVHWE